MPKQTNNSSNNAALKGFALTLVILILAVCVMAAMTEGFSNWNPYGWFDKPAEEQQTPEGDDPAPEQPTEEPAPIEATISNSEHIALAMSAAVTAADGEYVEQTLTATVTPSTAEELGVDWTVAWADGSDSPTLSDYLTITPASDGSNILYVRAYAAFEKDIIITATTHDGGFTATCTVKFVGNPSDMVIDFKGLSPVQDDGWGVPIYEIKTTSDYAFGVSFDNFFHRVNPAFVPNCEVSIACFGKVYIDVKTEDVSRELIALNEKIGSMSKSVQEASITVSMSGDSVVIDPLATVESFDLWKRVDRYTNYHWSFSDYEDSAKKPYFQITVKETNTGMTETFNVRIVSGVESVSLDHSEITF